MGIFDSFRKKKPEERSGKIEEATSIKGQPVPESRWQVGDRIRNRYQIFRVLGGPGKSGMGIVYICYDHEFKEAVALKTFQDRFLHDRAAVECFKWEAETWVRLEKHYNIVRANYVDTIDGRPFVFMEYVAGDEQYGTDLSGWIHNGGLGPVGQPDIPLILNFALQFCHGMIHAERQFQEMGKPFVHRDIKPQNIMVTRDKVVKVTDFGLVKSFAELAEDVPATTVGEGIRRIASLSKSGKVCGTPPYMSPEQCCGEKDIDVRSDIYSFGCVLYEMLTHRHLFHVKTADEFIYHHLKTLPMAPKAHPELDTVVMNCLQKRPEDRGYKNFKELEGALSSIYRELTGEEVKEPEAGPLEAWELSNKGFSLNNLEFHEDAIFCYQQALRINPNYAVAHNHLGWAFQAQGKLDEAVQEYQQALRINPNDAEAHLNLGVAYQGQGKLDEAIREYQEALRINPNFAQAHNNLGVAYQAQGKLDEAIQEYQQALRINPNYADVHYNLGNAYHTQRKPDEAIREYQQALRINPNYAEAHNNLGNAYKAQGKLDEAIREYQEALRINPNYTGAHFNLGNVYKAQGTAKEAIKSYRAFVGVAPPQDVSYVKQAEENIRQLEKKLRGKRK